MSEHYDVIIIGTGVADPTLAIVAKALRIGDHLLDRLGARKSAVAVGRNFLAPCNH